MDIADRNSGLQTIADVLWWRARNWPEALAYVFLKYGETEEARITYGNLDERARTIAAWLQKMGVCGERAILAYPPGLEFVAAFFGCLYANVIAVPVYAPRASQWEQNLPRFQAIANNAQAAVVLTTAALLPMGARLTDISHGLHPMRWHATETIDTLSTSDWSEISIDSNGLAFLQYTSGSTAAPKGVEVTHSNIMHNARSLQEARKQGENAIFVNWLPHYHDMGLIGNVLHAAYVGGTCYLMSPFAFLQSPSCWLKAISRYRATTSGGPNFAYDLCARRTTTEVRASLDLSCWTTAFTGSEPIRAETLERFTAAFEPVGFSRDAFFPCYGLAEATLFVAGRSMVSAEEHNRTGNHVSCGRPTGGHRVLIVDPDTCLECRPGEAGEIWISGPSIARGYWNQPAETQETFHARLANTGDGPFLRTGDLGLMPGGELFVTSRLKDLIIIRGENYYPQDIELTAENSHPSLRPNCGAAFSISIECGERLVIVHEIRPRVSTGYENIIDAIRKAVGLQHRIEVYSIVLIDPGSIPMTSSGKLQRRACRAAFLGHKLSVVSEWRSSEEAVTDALASTVLPVFNDAAGATEWLGSLVASITGWDKVDIDPNQPLASYIGDSLRAVELTHRVETAIGMQVTIGQWLGNRTLSELAEEIFCFITSSSKPDKYESRQPILDEYRLSHGQEGLWFLQQTAPDSSAYHLVAALEIQGDLNEEVLRDCFQELIDRHGALRTVFHISNGYLVQCVKDRSIFNLPMEDASGLSTEQLRRRLVEDGYARFNFESGPLFRVKLFSCNPRAYVLLVSMTHLIVDFWSLEILFNELSLLYRARVSGTSVELSPVTSHYSDYVEYERDLLMGPRGEQLWHYWRSQLEGELPVPNMGTPRLRTASVKKGGARSFHISAEITARILELARCHHATTYTVLLAAFQLLLHRYTGQDDIIVGSPFAGRASGSFASVIGYFTNPILLRARLAGKLSFEQHLAQVRDTVLAALNHQQFPISLLTQRILKMNGSGQRSLLQVMFVFHQTRAPVTDMMGLLALGQPASVSGLGRASVRPYPLDQPHVQFDLTLTLTEVEGRFWGSLAYDADMFGVEMVDRIVSHYDILLKSIADQPSRPVSEIEYLTEAERRQILRIWNATETLIPGGFVHQVIEIQAEKHPYEMAIIFERRTLTYESLNCRANQLARYLRSLGVRPDQPVGILMERSFEMVVAIIGVLKAGGAYLPLDPTYPVARLAIMLGEAAPPVVLTSYRFCDLISGCKSTVIAMEAIEERLKREGNTNLTNTVADDNIAYIIYTSGSTGHPKGVMNTHRGIRNRLVWMQDTFHLLHADRVLQKTPFSFDVSVWEFLWPLMTGSCLVVARPGGHQDPQYLVDLITSERITTVHFVPSMLRAVLDGPGLQRCSTLKHVICSGEALTYELQTDFFASGVADLHNLYGPTEAAIDVTHWKCERGESSLQVPIGRPIHNTAILVLDQFQQLLPPGIVGELYIEGEGLARGYYNRPDLTAERFIPNSYASQPGERLYRTGDLARYLPGGAIEFLGRRDNQIKIRGFRVELDEITAILESLEFIRQAVVIPYDSEAGLRLITYIVAVPERTPTGDGLREYLKTRLPDYMIPSVFLFLEAMPLNPNGKLDRRGLLPPPSAGTVSTEFVAPRTPIEETIVGIWAETLETDRIGVHDNFFALGGHSLLMTRVVSRLRDLFGIDVSIATFFQGPTVAEIAVEATRLIAEKRSGVSLDDLLKQVEQLSDEEVQVVIDAREIKDANAADLHRRADVEIFGSGSKRLAYSKENLAVRVIEADLAQTIEDLRQFMTIQDYTATMRSSSADDVAGLRGRLESLASDGYLVSHAHILSDLCRSDEPSEQNSQIETVGFITNNRADVLPRAITSFVEHFRDFDRRVRIAVVDNSRDEEVRSAYRHALEEVQNRHGIGVAYAGLDEKMRFALLLKRRRRVPDDVIDFALFGEAWAGSRAGANRNALLLHTPGSMLLSLDDDSVCRGAILPEAVKGIQLYSETPRDRSSSLPSQVRSLRDRDTVFQMAKPLQFDLLQAHEFSLGRSVNNCIAVAGTGSDINLDAASPSFLRRLRNSRSRVLVTLNGLIGDCGWASPSPYLFLRDKSLAELIRTEEAYRSACVSRNILRSVDRLTIADRADEMMTLFTGLDNRDLLPPFVPVGRGQDAVFGATLGESVPEGCVCYLPWALLHLPPDSRSFWPGETLRSASGISLSFLLSICIRSTSALSAPGDRAESLRRLGYALEQLGKLPAREFQEEIQRRVCREVAVLADELEESAGSRGGLPAFWTDDVNKFLEILRESVTRDEFFVPMDLLYRCGIEEASFKSRRVVREFGRLLSWWPELVELSRNLQSDGIELAQPVAQSVA